jgi:putative transcriptional regulator
MYEEQVGLRTGVLITAAPMMRDPNFRRSVVLLCHHNEEGTFGLILNRVLPFKNDELEQLLGGWSPTLRFGGPCQSNTVHYLHALSDDLPDAQHVADRIFWGGDFDRVQELARESLLSESNFQFFLGYAGWGPDQLESEVANNDWIVAPAYGDLIFDTAPERLWSAVMRNMGGTNALLANFPADPRLN